MEIGRTTELTVLTPGDVRWIERALDALQKRGDAMAREALAQGHGRSLACGGTQANSREGGCGKPATHYSVDANRGRMQGYCDEHWRRDMDPNDHFKLSGDTSAGAGASSSGNDG